MLSLLHHQNLVNLIDYCADGEQRLLVYEYMPLGSLEDHLLDLAPGRPCLPWFTRMKIALDTSKGLKEFNAKLFDFGLAMLGPVGDKSHVSTRVMGTYGYCAPEYQRTGQLTPKSDVYSFALAHMTPRDILVCILAFVPTGWGLLLIAQACKLVVHKFGFWGSVRTLARGYEILMGLLLFTPMALLAWFPFVSEFQTRMLFNQALNRGLQISCFLGGHRKDKSFRNKE
ncbi:hypothetical protein ACS0TY_000252 [Phlomoides rotata]